MRARLTFAAVACVALVATITATAAGTKLTPRPTFAAKEYTVESPYIVVHYTRTGPDHPRFIADDNHNGVPNYIEKLAASLNKAYLFYGHNGFKAPLADTAGPNSKIDVYVKALPRGLFGVSIPPTEGKGGAFMVIDNQLDEALLAKHGSLQQTAAHELFHLFQFSYVPNGRLPVWAAEGSALALQTYVYPKVADVATFDYIDHWLDQPQRSLYDEQAGCDHCYGGALWWRFVFGLGSHVMPEYFGRLYGYQKIGKPILDGTQPLEEVLKKQAHGSLYRAFTRFSYDIYRAGYKPKPLYTLTADPAVQRTPIRIVRGLSTHYVPVSIPPDAKGIALGVAAGGGPNPEVKLVVGGPKGRVVEGVLRSRGHEQYFVTPFRTAKERSSVELIVTSGRKVGTGYLVAYQAITK